MPGQYPFDYVLNGSGQRILPITHMNGVRDSSGNTLPDILDEKYPEYQAGTSSDLSTGTDTSTKIWSPKVIHDYIASVMINPISDGSISNSQNFAPRDCINVNDTMYLCDNATSEYPIKNLIVQDDCIVVLGDYGIVLDNTASADWHSF